VRIVALGAAYNIVALGAATNPSMYLVELALDFHALEFNFVAWQMAKWTVLVHV